MMQTEPLKFLLRSMQPLSIHLFKLSFQTLLEVLHLGPQVGSWDHQVINLMLHDLSDEWIINTWKNLYFEKVDLNTLKCSIQEQ